jgi:hypothetical protein
MSFENERKIHSEAEALQLVILQPLCSKNFNFFLKMERMWAEPVLAPLLHLCFRQRQ